MSHYIYVTDKRLTTSFPVPRKKDLRSLADIGSILPWMLCRCWWVFLGLLLDIPWTICEEEWESQRYIWVRLTYLSFISPLVRDPNAIFHLYWDILTYDALLAWCNVHTRRRISKQDLTFSSWPRKNSYIYSDIKITATFTHSLSHIIPNMPERMMSVETWIWILFLISTITWA